ncbi:MAG: glucose-1-phosphate cytidylyltransferase [Candidatus Abawacabacteria bacterium]|nr:glucose-1-phosphate cytidylyltransferase [Candidatus Abawacabacteria bacterium]
MKTVILCGGMGTRLREETEFKPKPMVNIGGYPIIWHIMKIYAHYGHKEFVLPLGYKGEMIKEYFIGFDWRNKDFSLDLATRDVKLHANGGITDWLIHFVETGVESMTMSRLFQVKHLLLEDEDNDDYFMLTYGDGVADIDLDALLEFHKEKGKMITLTGINPPGRWGIIEVDANHIITDFAEKPQSTEFVNGGFMIMNKEIFKYVDQNNLMIEVDLLPRMAKMGQVALYHHQGFWQAMDTYRDFTKLNEIWETEHPWKKW